MLQEEIKAIIDFQADSFNSKKVEITEETTLGEIFGNLSEPQKKAPELFKGNVLWTLERAGHKRQDGGKNRFPNGWLNLTKGGLAEKLFLLVIMLTMSLFSMAQLSFSVGSIKTDLRKNAIDFSISYLKNLDSTFGHRDYFIPGKNSYFLARPEVEFRTGTQDAFSSIILKVSGNFVTFKTTKILQYETPDPRKTMHVFPVNLGVETNNQFNFINGLLEAGYEPYYQGPAHKGPEWLKHTKFGAYLQAGKKFDIDAPDSLFIGGAKDESEERPGGGILRLKGDLMANTDAIVRIGGVKIGVVGRGTTWYDLLHSALYYRVEGNVRFFLNQSTNFDVKYAKGSGAPNFNTGDQFGVGLNINF